MTSAFFEKLLDEHGDSPRALDWSTVGQADRFRVLGEVGIGQHSVLDVGCGLGHFNDYLVGTSQFRGAYLGVDVSAAMVSAADGRRKTRSSAFAVADALHGPALPVHDYVVSSGMLNVEDGLNEASMRSLLRRCFDACQRGCAVNMLSVCAAKKRDGRHYYDPGEMLREALAVTPRATLRHDYRDNDFTLYLYRAAA